MSKANVPPGNNCHPIDRLAEVRAQLAELRAEEEALRKEILKGECGLIGANYAASIQTHSRETVILSKLKHQFGRQLLEPFLKSFTCSRIYLREIEDAPHRSTAPTLAEIEGE